LASTITCEMGIVSILDGRPGPVDGATAPASSDVKYVPYRWIVPDGGPGGTTCITTRYWAERAGAPPENISNTGLFSINADYPECPAEPAAGRPETPASIAIRYWHDVPLPAPRPHIAPGRAITGMYAYMETRGATTATFTEPDTPFGPLTIEATGSYHVDWGDGTRTGPHSQEGGPWPGGEIKHEYINVGDYDVVVTEGWTATWSFGTESGTLGSLQTEGRIDDFPVQQIQAVVLR